MGHRKNEKHIDLLGRVMYELQSCSYDEIVLVSLWLDGQGLSANNPGRMTKHGERGSPGVVRRGVRKRGQLANPVQLVLVQTSQRQRERISVGEEDAHVDVSTDGGGNFLKH